MNKKEIKENYLKELTKDEIAEHVMLVHSNAIEDVWTGAALRDAIKAWNCANNIKGSIQIQDILDMHRILMRNLEPGIAGYIRKCNVMVGGRICPKPYLIRQMLNTWLTYTNSILSGEKSIHIKSIEDEVISWHVKFEKIHPFVDGNGRAGRILYNIHRKLLGLPIHIIRYEERFSYYEWFR
jgi:Fic family protein